MAQITGVGSPISEILSHDEKPFLEEWTRHIYASTRSNGSISESDLQQECFKFFHSFRKAFDAAGTSTADAPAGRI